MKDKFSTKYYVLGEISFDGETIEYVSKDSNSGTSRKTKHPFKPSKIVYTTVFTKAMIFDSIYSAEAYKIKLFENLEVFKAKGHKGWINIVILELSIKPIKQQI